jgi:hypothetical protein
VRLPGQAFQNPLRDRGELPGRQAHMRDGRRAGEIGQITQINVTARLSSTLLEDHHVPLAFSIAVAHRSDHSPARTSKPSSSSLIARNDRRRRRRAAGNGLVTAGPRAGNLLRGSRSNGVKLVAKR